MSRLIIEQARGGFLITRSADVGQYSNDRSVACSTDILLNIVGAWARGETWVPPTWATGTPPVAPDAAPAPFRVGDRVVLKDATRKLMGSTGPWEIADVGACRARIHVPGSGLRDWFFTPNELRHAPVEDL